MNFKISKGVGITILAIISGIVYGLGKDLNLHSLCWGGGIGLTCSGFLALGFMFKWFWEDCL